MSKKEENPTDIFGFELIIGDTVAFNPPHYKGLLTGKIIGFGGKSARISYKEHGVGRETTCTRPLLDLAVNLSHDN